MNVKETLKRLHKKFPMMGLDELFDVLDCYVEEVDLSKTISTWKPSWEQPKIWCYDNNIDTMPIKTNGIEFNKNSISCNKMDRKYDGNTTTTADLSSAQFATGY